MCPGGPQTYILCMAEVIVRKRGRRRLPGAAKGSAQGFAFLAVAVLVAVGLIVVAVSG